MRVTGSRLASYFLFVAVFLALFLSGAALNDLGFNYSGNDGSGGIKVHPYVVFTLLAVLVRIASRSGVANRRLRLPIVCSAVAVLVLVVRAATTGTESLGFAVDTLLAAFWVAAVSPGMNERVSRGIWKLGLLFVVFESSIAIFEVLTKTHFIPVDTWYGSYFRATALHGHPLNNALILATIALALQVSGTRRVCVFVFPLTVAALSGFGARGALLVYLALSATMLARFGMRSVGKMALVSFGVPLTAVMVGWTLISGTLGDRIANVGAYDSSSNVRLQSLSILQRLNWTHVLMGTDPDQVSRMMARANVGVIENFLVAYVLMFGLVCTLLLLACIWICFRVMIGECSRITRRRLLLVFIAFFLISLTNNSLVTKTPALYLCFVFCWAAAREIERRRQPASIGE